MFQLTNDYERQTILPERELLLANFMLIADAPQLAIPPHQWTY